MKQHPSRPDVDARHSPRRAGGSGLPVPVSGAVRLAFEQALCGEGSTPLARRIGAVLKRRVGIVYRTCLWAVQRASR